MATTGKWEVVVKPSKKNKAAGQHGQKANKKHMAENMPRIEAAAPVKESPTIYDAFIEKDHHHSAKQNGKEQLRQNGTGGDNQPGNNRKNQVQRKKQTNDKKKDHSTSLQEAVKKIDPSEMETMLTKDQTRFPDNPSVWLKDLASFLNIKLESVPENDPIFDGKPKDYPLCELPGTVQKMISNTLDQCSDTTLDLFLEHSVQSMINDMGRGMSTYGYRMIIQLLAHNKPEIPVRHLTKFVDLLKANQNRQLRCLSIMWAVGQVGFSDLASGLKVWHDVMLPVLNLRALCNYAVDYLHALFSRHTDLSPAYNSIGFRDFFPILDLMFGSNSVLPTALQKKLLSLYPKLKIIAFGSDPSTSMRNFFPSFLARVSPSCSKPLKAELLSSLVTCLGKDKHCYSVWRQMYTKHMLQSSELLHHLVDNWDNVCKVVDRKLLRDTVQAFSITNDELAPQKTWPDGYKQCVHACKELLTKMNTWRFPWRLLLLFLVAAIAGLIAYDTHIHGSFRQSKTFQWLNESGVLVFLQQVWLRINTYCGKAIQWLKLNVPYYYSQYCDFARPYLLLFWDKLCAFGLWVMEVTQPVTEWLRQKIPIMMDWVWARAPHLWQWCGHYLSILWEWVVHWTSWLWQFVCHVFHVVTAWLTENVFIGSWSPENIHKVLVSSLTALSENITALWHWCRNLVMTSSQ